MADMQTGTANIEGTLDASAPGHLNPGGGNGGFIETSGALVIIAQETKVATRADNGQTGTWLIDPTDFTISSCAGGRTGSGIGATALESNLTSNNVILETVVSGSEAGDVHVNTAISQGVPKPSL